MHPKSKGELTEQIIICEFMKLGIPVSKPIGDNQPYDLIIDINNHLLKVQCRTGRFDKDNIIFNCLSCRLNMTGCYIKDNRDKFDLFAVYCREVYIIDSNLVVTDKGRLSCKDSHSKLPLAIHYRLDYWWHNLKRV